ncbi:hypothetical protein KPH14_004901 [Odynerus spinipes]|uniref:Ubiquitin-like domain-containing protein n=1 Tax=Odynerus spinipes TaxID=1348599 RepID=A0AAD9RMS1_9HYME|nr:hypothetical protein KPH14_004901 [Odynerus spinipes]
MLCYKNECKCQPQIVTVRTLDGRHTKIQMSYSETVETLKHRIASIYQTQGNQDWPPERIKLWLGGYYLEENRTLSDYDLTSKDRIIMQYQ